ncbi:hypothetical protein DT351_11005 (plasmid) [Latilactobacillus curvatus]|uniref:Uncharacterized protein n=1 Tax=Latilactobacillus curvatus TaxID=28038 RepID=A0A385AGP1_LATCU|nr:hypothetical protein [Latilactobacillus curvatus]AXN36869.1 hypothetical protein DT351_11005 [Latilactobacillus curvatus]
MEIKIRNLSKKAVSALNDLAKIKGVSREKYVRDLLENYIQNKNVTGEVADLNETLAHALTVIENNTVAFNQIMLSMKEGAKRNDNN